ncbi:MAG TPA: outer membrane beta-barrel protein [Candidatus Polarisedimenticolaceae bacterium]|nr:outer membrane beta-barrel protein [Candidatus Polarisedimenticolaceae bacterium]
MRLGPVLAACALAAVSLPALAQSISPLEPPDTSRYLKWGPIRIRPGLQIPNFGYDSNVFYRPDDSTLPQVGDYFIAIAPRAEGLVLFGRRAFLTFDERLEFYVYAQQHDVNYFNQLGRMRLTIPFRRIGLYADLGYDRIRDRPIDAQDARPIRKEIPTGGGFVFKAGWRTDGEIGITRSRFTGEDPDDPCVAGTGCLTIGQRIDRVESGSRLRLRYLAFGRARVLLDASRRTIVFDDPAVQRDGKERRVLPGLDFGLGGRVFGTLHVGWADFDLDKPTATDFRGTVADVALGYRFGGSGSYVTLTGTRDVRYSVLESTDLYTYTGADAMFVKYFNRFLGMELGGGRGTLDFLGDPTGRRDDVLTGSAGIRFRISENDLGRRVEYAFRYVNTKRNSTDDSLDQTRGTVGFGVSFGY